MAIDVGTVTGSGEQNNSSGFSFNHTCHADTTVLVVVVIIRDSSGTDMDMSAAGAVTYDSDNMTLEQIDLAIIDCYRRYYMPKMMEFRKIKDDFRREYLVSSTKLIMKSSFLIGKFARLGINPKTIMQKVFKK